MTLSDLPVAERHWRFNSTLLSNNDFVKFMEEQITFFFDTNASSETTSLTIWDALKAYLRGQIISFSASMKKRAQKERIDLSIQIKEVDQRYAQTKSPELYKKRVELQTRFDLLSTHSIERQLLQSKSLFYVHGDKSGKMLPISSGDLKQNSTSQKSRWMMVTPPQIPLKSTTHLGIFTPDFTLLTSQMAVRWWKIS